VVAWWDGARRTLKGFWKIPRVTGRLCQRATTKWHMRKGARHESRSRFGTSAPAAGELG
jgi:hypothetical protein